MLKKIIAILLTALLLGIVTACGGSSSTQEQDTQNQESQAVQESESNEASQEADTSRLAALASSISENKESIISTNASKFEQLEYADPETGLSITYNLHLPENYDSSGSYPLVVFISDSSSAGKEAQASLSQGLGGVIWASDEWQSAYPTIVAVPTYPETILDDHNGYSTTEYVELTKRFVDYMGSEYAVDKDRIYGTGQSMGCMTTMLLTSEYPDLYTACMLVDGQWDVNALHGLASQKFVYFAAEDDSMAWQGAQEVMQMFDSESVPYAYAQWDGTWSAEEIAKATQDLFKEDMDKYFISWKTGTISAGSNGGNSEAGGEAGGPGGHGGQGGGLGGMGGASYHMASFDYAYSCVSVMQWLFEQRR